MGVRLRLPLGVELVAFQDAHLARLAFDDPGVLDAFDSDAAGAGEVVGHAIVALAHAVLFEPADGKARVGIEFALNAAEVFIEFGIDELQCSFHAHRAVVGFQYRLVARKNTHARPNG